MRAMIDLSNLTAEITSFPIDREFISQDKLDIVTKARTSLYPWRGQFSPGLVDVFLDAYAQANTIVFDPFVGSGTTLFEATRRGLKCYGSEINPAAVFFANMARFANLDIQARRHIFVIAEQLIEKHIGDYVSATIFRPTKSKPPDGPIKNAIIQEWH